MDFSHVFHPRRWRQRFKSEELIQAETLAAGRVPDATVDEVGAASSSVGFDGTPLRDKSSNGYGTGDRGGSGWAGWGA